MDFVTYYLWLVSFVAMTSTVLLIIGFFLGLLLAPLTSGIKKI